MFRKLFVLACMLFLCLHAETISCEGLYPGHLQGIDCDGKHIYWSFTSQLVKTDMKGKIVKAVPVTRHCGDIAVHEGKIYCSINQGKFNQAAGSKDSLQILDAETLALLKTIPVKDYPHGFGAVEIHNGHIWVTGGLVKNSPANIVLEYTMDMELVKRYETPGYTHLGIQTLNYAFGYWWYGVYGKPYNILCNDKLEKVSDVQGPGLSVGMAVLNDGTMLIAYTKKQEQEVAPTPENPNPKKKTVWNGFLKTATFDLEKKTITLKNN